jgi:hypothetical protein
VTPASNSSAAVSSLSTGNAESALAPAAPQVVIIRNPGAAAPSISIQTGNNKSAVVATPQPVIAPVQNQSSIPAIQAPAPVIQQSAVQQPAVQSSRVQPAPRSRSSR